MKISLRSLTASMLILLTTLYALACKQKDEPAPIPKKTKYVYKRTPGEVYAIEGDIFVDTGMTMFTVKGKGFDPKKKSNYHLLMMAGSCSGLNSTKFKEFIQWPTYFTYIRDTAKLVSITDSSVSFLVNTNNIYNARDHKNGTPGCAIKDSIDILFGATSNDSTRIYDIIRNFDELKTKKVRNKLFFNIQNDTLYWYKRGYKYDINITLDDANAGWLTKNRIQVYFNEILLNTVSATNFSLTFDTDDTRVGDAYLLFQEEFYNLNKDLGLKEGFYNITMKDKLTGLPIEERHGKKKIYLKFVD